MHFFIKKRQNKKTQKQVDCGFSLIEVLVSLSIFAMVVTISVGSLMVLVEANARSRGVHTAMTNLSFALDSMTREIRTGSDYFCGGTSNALPVTGTTVSDCSNNEQNFFSFNEGGDSLTEGMGSSRIGFRLNNNIIERRLGDPSNGGLDWHAITDTNVHISALEFYVYGSTPLSDVSQDAIAPVVTIYISGYVESRGSDETFDIQTSIAQQLLDI